jgi:hypothetical protein
MHQPIFSSPEEYFDMASKLHALIMEDFESASSDFLSAHYPKMVVMYEFFRLIRGEAFLDLRPSMGDKQSQLYAMEDEIKERLATIRQQLNPDDASLRFHIEEMQRYFDVNRD